ncbi:MAG: PEGA domain-containing protein [Methanoregula sp.]
MRYVSYVVILCLLSVLVQGVSAFTVPSLSVNPSGTLNPGDPINISYTVYAASGVAFPSYDDLQFITELSDPVWTYTIAVNGIKNTRPAEGGRVLTISGFELAYQNRDEVIVLVSLAAQVPAGSALGANKTLVRIQELDARGYVIPYSVVEINHLIGQPTPTPTPSFGTLTVASTPPGADVYIDNAYKGLTQVGINAIPNGNHVISIRLDGYQDYSRTIVVMGDTQTITAALVPKPTPTTIATTPVRPNGNGTLPQGTPAGGFGSLAVTTSPAGAQVYVDGSLKGITPTTIPGLSSGAHAIILKMDGFQDLGTTITITSGQTAEYTTGLSRNAKTPGFELLPALLSLGMLILARRIR